jgi:hypothetical protein
LAPFTGGSIHDIWLLPDFLPDEPQLPIENRNFPCSSFMRNYVNAIGFLHVRQPIIYPPEKVWIKFVGSFSSAFPLTGIGLFCVDIPHDANTQFNIRKKRTLYSVVEYNIQS